MSASWNFARRPFQDDRPVYAAAGLLVLLGAVLLVANVRLFTGYRRDVAGVRSEIAALEARQRGADTKARDARAALSSYRLSALADESRELSRIVAERRFSWTGLLARLERTLPSDVGIAHLQPQFDKSGDIELNLQLVGRSRESVVPTIAALAHDPAFASVQVHTETLPDAGSSVDPFLFEIASRYTPEDTEKDKDKDKNKRAAVPAPRAKPASPRKPLAAKTPAAPGKPGVRR